MFIFNIILVKIMIHHILLYANSTTQSSYQWKKWRTEEEYFMPLVSFCNPWKRKKTIRKMCSWGIEKDKWHEMG